MNCQACNREMSTLGCTVENRPLHWCPACGTLVTCDGVAATPAYYHEWTRTVGTLRSINGIWADKQ